MINGPPKSKSGKTPGEKALIVFIVFGVLALVLVTTVLVYRCVSRSNANQRAS